ncbi:MAG: protein translocase subunit SecF [Alphaproteobacteria bacterium]|nr:MAG: protein translocase subunit SecF [Alphaproteobacteria bacterium]
MQGLRFFPSTPTIDFIGARKVAYGIALFVVLGAFAAWAVKGFNFGIDFRGGYLIEGRFTENVDLRDVREKLNTLDVGDVRLQALEKPTDILIRAEMAKSGFTDEQVIASIKSVLGKNVTYRRVETVGPKVSETLVQGAIWSVIWAMLAMLVYVWLRFEWQFSVCGILALMHDCIGVLGFYAISHMEFNETAIIAILTTAGYSINDTVVIYDRIRENFRRFTHTPMDKLVNQSINETLSRTMLTSGTTLLALAALYIFGGEVISNFSLPIIVGISLGTFSSICVSALLLLFFDIDRDHFVAKEGSSSRTKV